MKHLIVLFMVSGSLLIQAQTRPANLSGTVIDQTGAPVAGAIVYAVDQGLADAIPPSTKTDGNGAFDFHRSLDLGAYKVYARKDADGYPDPFDSFYSDPEAEAPRIELSQAHPAASVAVKLGPKAATVAGRVVDANTGTAVKARLAFVDADGHGHSVSVDGDYRIQVPPGKNVTLMVVMMPTRFLVPGPPLKLEPGQYVYLEIPVPAQ
jgi:hypothetical protein